MLRHDIAFSVFDGVMPFYKATRPYLATASSAQSRVSDTCLAQLRPTKQHPLRKTYYLRSSIKPSSTPLRPSTVRSAVNNEVSGRVALEGDTVTVHFTVFGEDGGRLESTKDAGQPLTFEVGSSEVVGNDLLHAFDGGIRGLSVGGKRRVELEPLQGDWSEELLFTVPKDHPELQRLEGKFRSSGGLQEGMIVELANGSQAQVVKFSEDAVILDANNAMAGRRISFEIELMNID